MNAYGAMKKKTRASDTFVRSGDTKRREPTVSPCFCRSHPCEGYTSKSKSTATGLYVLKKHFGCTPAARLLQQLILLNSEGFSAQLSRTSRVGVCSLARTSLRLTETHRSAMMLVYLRRPKQCDFNAPCW